MDAWAGNQKPNSRVPVRCLQDSHTSQYGKQKGAGGVSSTRQVRDIVQVCFDEAAARLRRDGLESDADNLQTATVHWLRHTGISDDVKRRPKEHVRDDAGHGSSAITDRYIDLEKRERHASAKKKSIRPLTG